MSAKEADGMYGLPAALPQAILAPAELVTMADGIREEWHRDRLEEARIAVVLIPKGAASEGHVELGHASALGKIPALLAGYDFVLQIAWDQWLKLTDARRKALVDHLLTHCDKRVNGKGEVVGWKLRKHDVGEFGEIVKRHGLWTGDLEAIGPVVHERQQMLWELDMPTDEEYAAGIEEGLKPDPASSRPAGGTGLRRGKPGGKGIDTITLTSRGRSVTVTPGVMDAALKKLEKDGLDRAPHLVEDLAAEQAEKPRRRRRVKKAGAA